MNEMRKLMEAVSPLSEMPKKASKNAPDLYVYGDYEDRAGAGTVKGKIPAAKAARIFQAIEDGLATNDEDEMYTIIHDTVKKVMGKSYKIFMVGDAFWHMAQNEGKIKIPYVDDAEEALIAIARSEAEAKKKFLKAREELYGDDGGDDW